MGACQKLLSGFFPLRGYGGGGAPLADDDSPLEEPEDDVILVPCAAPYESYCHPMTELEEGPNEEDWGPEYPDDAEDTGVFEDWGPV